MLKSKLTHITFSILINLSLLLVIFLSSNNKDQNISKEINISLLSSNEIDKNGDINIISPNINEIKTKKNKTQNLDKSNIKKNISENKFIPAQYNYGSLSNPAPIYPKIAIRNKHQGKVIICVSLDNNGIPKKVNICNSSGSNILDIAAINTVKKWHFQAAKLGSKNIESKIEVPITFTLES